MVCDYVKSSRVIVFRCESTELLAGTLTSTVSLWSYDPELHSLVLLRSENLDMIASTIVHDEKFLGEYQNRIIKWRPFRKAIGFGRDEKMTGMVNSNCRAICFLGESVYWFSTDKERTQVFSFSCQTEEFKNVGPMLTLSLDSHPLYVFPSPNSKIRCILLVTFDSVGLLWPESNVFERVPPIPVPVMKGVRKGEENTSFFGTGCVIQGEVSFLIFQDSEPPWRLNDEQDSHYYQLSLKTRAWTLVKEKTRFRSLNQVVFLAPFVCLFGILFGYSGHSVRTINLDTGESKDRPLPNRIRAERLTGCAVSDSCCSALFSEPKDLWALQII